MNHFGRQVLFVMGRGLRCAGHPLLARCLAAVLCLGAVPGCGGALAEDNGGTGSETNWLSPCDEDTDCDQGSCLCGICSQQCESTDDCGAIVKTECLSGAALARCDIKLPAGEGICATDAALETAIDAQLGDGGSPDGGSELSLGESSNESVGESSEESSDGISSTSGEFSAGIEPQTTTPEPPDETPAPTLLDVLIVVDNSMSMADKQELFVLAMPQLVNELTSPPCVASPGAVASGVCAEGTAPAFPTLESIHFGVISTSLGGYGAEADCVSAAEGEVDNAHLLTGSPGGAVLGWCAEGAECDLSPLAAPELGAALTARIQAIGEFGCGWESSLESWYRFLVEPVPPQQLVRINCDFGGDTRQSCIGPLQDESGAAVVDATVLEHRAQFLRPNSMLLVILLTDEDDCSFKADGQSWRLSQSRSAPSADAPTGVPNRAFRGSSTCATSPNDPCCHSCGAGAPAGCPTESNASGMVVGAGCSEPRYPSTDDLAGEAPTEDAVNLRCFNQKQRFGVDYLYPVERYSNALTQAQLCLSAPNLDADSCDSASLIDNPLFAGRSRDDVIIAGIVGAPWQDLAVDPTAETTLTYRAAAPSAAESERLNWSWLIGERYPARGIFDPQDPLMRAQIEPREGMHPATGVALAPAGGGTVHPVNGGEWSILDRDDLQYVCITPLLTPKDCPQTFEAITSTSPNCDCTFYGAAEYNNPLCAGFSQHSARAYPATRQLQVMYDVADRAVVGSVCAKQVADSAREDFGYRPSIAAITRRVGQRLSQR